MCGIIESRSVGAQAALGTHTQANYHNYVATVRCLATSNKLFPVPEQPSYARPTSAEATGFDATMRQWLTTQRRGHWVKYGQCEMMAQQHKSVQLKQSYRSCNGTQQMSRANR